MKHEDIKVGDVYNVRVRVVDVDDDTGEITTETANENGYALGFEWCYYAPGEALAFSPISTENGIKNTEPAPKYDPCRKFRKGDKVRLIEWNGRKPFDTLHGLKLNPGEVHIVLDDEYERNEVYIGMSAADEEQSVVHACNLELITPVEDVEPYIVEKSNDGSTIVFTVKKRDCSQGLDFRFCPGWGGNIFFSENHCRKHAEAERARLNAEYIKELENA